MLQVGLPPDAQHLVQIDPFPIIRRGVSPALVPQVFVQLVEEHLDVVRDAAAQPPAHVLADLRGKIDTVLFGQRREARGGDYFAPRS